MVNCNLFDRRVGTKGKSGKTRSSPMRYRSESPSMHYTTTTASKHNDYRTAKQGLYDQDMGRSFSPQYNSSQDDIYKSSSLYTTKREEVN